MTMRACASLQRILFVCLFFSHSVYRCKSKASFAWSAHSSGQEVSLIPCVHFGRWPVRRPVPPSHLSWLYRYHSCGCRWPAGPRCCRGSPGSPRRSPRRSIGPGWTVPCRRWLPTQAGMRQGEFSAIDISFLRALIQNVAKVWYSLIRAMKFLTRMSFV